LKAAGSRRDKAPGRTRGFRPPPPGIFLPKFFPNRASSLLFFLSACHFERPVSLLSFLSITRLKIGPTLRTKDCKSYLLLAFLFFWELFWIFFLLQAALLNLHRDFRGVPLSFSCYPAGGISSVRWLSGGQALRSGWYGLMPFSLPPPQSAENPPFPPEGLWVSQRLDRIFLPSARVSFSPSRIK